MKKSVAILLLCLSIAACRTPPNLDYERIGRDIDFLIQSEPKIKNPWQILDLVPFISSDTLEFLSQNKHYCETDKAIKSPLCETSKKLKLSVGAFGVQLNSLTPQPLPTSAYQSNFDPSLTARFESLVREKKVFTWEFIDKRERQAHYCNTECLCITQVMADHLSVSSFLQARVALRLMPANGGLGVRIKDANGVELSFPAHHTALLLKFVDGGWGVVDQIAFGNVRVHTSQEWFNHVIDFQHLSAAIYSIH